MDDLRSGTPDRIFYICACAVAIGHDAAGDLRPSPASTLVPRQHRRAGRVRDACIAREYAGAARCRAETLREAKRMGFSDTHTAGCSTGKSERGDPHASARRPGSMPVLQDGRHLRRRVRGLHPLLLLDLRDENESVPHRPRKKVVILGGGPNRIGQGIEFDYCCVHAPSRCGRWATRPSWSTATRRRSPPTTTPPTGSTSSR